MSDQALSAAHCPPWRAAPDGAWLRAPDGRLVDLRRRRNLRRLVHALVEARRLQPGEPVDRDELIARLWPGERMLQRAARARLHVAVSSLRQLAFGQDLRHERGGYLLSTDLDVLALDDAPRCDAPTDSSSPTTAPRSSGSAFSATAPRWKGRSSTRFGGPARTGRAGSK